MNHGEIAKAGSGGDLKGIDGKETINKGCVSSDSYIPSYFKSPVVATQTSGGISRPGSFSVTNGTFGKGGSLTANGFIGTGGEAGNSINCKVLAGAGGSSYISGFEGCDSIAENSTEESIYHTGRKKHFSGFEFSYPLMINGENEMPQPLLYSNTKDKGRNGNGCVRITVILSSNMIKTCRSLILNSRNLLILIILTMAYS